MNLKNYIATIKDFPKPGIMFRDVTPLMNDGEAFNYTCTLFSEYAKKQNANVVIGPEARGFIFACPVACMNKIGFAPVRKPNKLPRKAISASYDLEYGSNELCIHDDSIKKGDRVLIVDDLLATGGTLKAAIELVEQLGGEVVGIATVIELVDLHGREALKGYDIYSLIEYEGE